MPKRAADNRADYYRMIHRYEKMRIEKKEELTIATKKIKKQIYGYTQKIKTWKRAIRRIDERRLVIEKFNSLIKRRYNFSLRNSA